MVALFDLAMGLGCACCNPFGPGRVPDIVCHKCKAVLLSAREPGPDGNPLPETADPLDLTPKT